MIDGNAEQAMQALYKLALSPVAETTADRNSYGFREGRSGADAVAAAFNALSKPNSATWVWEKEAREMRELSARAMRNTKR